MTDDRPRPKYGEYAPLGTPAAAVPVVSAPTAVEPEVQPVTPRRTWDVALTAALLILGVLDVAGSFSRFGSLAATLRDAYAQQGIGQFTSDQLANDMGIAINVTRVVLLVAAIGFGLWRLGHNKVAFWVPLAIGGLSLLVVLVCLLVVVLTDPALAEFAMQQANSS